MSESKAAARDSGLNGHESASDAFDRVVARLKDVRQTSKGVRARCPAHEDSKPSLDVDRGDDGKVLLNCRSRTCTAEAITAAIGMEMSDLFPRGGQPQGREAPRAKAKQEPTRHPTADRAVRAAHWSATDSTYDGKLTRYVYQDAKATDIGIVVRIDFDDGRPKTIRRVSRDGDSWLCRDMGTPKPLYRLPELLASPTDEPILLVEGEKCADALTTLGFVATTSSGGAHAPLSDTDWSAFAGRTVVALPDNDAPGRSYCTNAVSQARASQAASVRILALDGLAEGEDVYDWAEARLAQGRTRDDIITELKALIGSAKEAPEKQPESEAPDEVDARPGQDLVKLGERDPATGRLVLSPKKTLPTAHAYLREFHAHEDGPTLYDYGGFLWLWKGNKFVEIEPGRLAQQLHTWLHGALRYSFNRETKCLELIDFDGNPATVAHALATIRAVSHLPATTPAPTWIGGDPPVPLRELIPCKTMNLHIPTGRTLPATPRLFCFNAIDFDFDPHAPDPTRWLAFLDELFGSDTQSIDLLQEWFGYCLTADTSQQKMLLVVGPRRSGKGTIARVLSKLVGTGNFVGPTVSGLAGEFGLQPLLGKSLAVVSDARFAGENIMTVVERLLCISGEDAITVNRKFLSAVTMPLPVRFVFLTNELPRFNDSSTALAGRFVALRLTKSFYGTEDVGLSNALMAELPGILLWAIYGWERLRSRGRFQEPESSRAAIADIEDLSSPVNAFVRERCVLGPGHRIACPDLYAAWCEWCTADGRTSHTTAQVFGRDLAAAAPGVYRRRCTGRRAFYEGIGLTTGEMP